MILPVALVAHLAGACAPGAAPGTLAAVATAESGFDTLAIRDDTTDAVWRPRRRSEAEALARRLIGRGHAVDLGLMQIDSANLVRLHLPVSRAFDPCASLAAGARLLTEDYEPARPRSGGEPTQAAEQAALLTAFSRYNTGSPTAGFRNGYVARVVKAAQRIVPEIDPRTVLPAEPGATPPVNSWAIFGSAKHAAPRDASSNWNVFPQSVGPDRLAARPPATAAKNSVSPAKIAIGGTNDNKGK
jgi:type IV secretion system protein VirB1